MSNEETPELYYHGGYKYQTTRPFVIKTTIKPARNIETDWILLRTDGMLFFTKGYAWDGPSGPTIDTDSWMIPSLVHDGLCQLVSMGLLAKSWLTDIHLLMYRLCIRYKMLRARAWYSWKAVVAFYKPGMSKKKELCVGGE